MRFTLGWFHSAENELARIWMRAKAQGKGQAVRQAADRIEQLLRFSSHTRGNDVAGVYQLSVWPLRVVFEVSPDDRKVTVQQVTYLG